MGRNASTWKDHERRIAKRLGGERVPVADNRSSTDVLHPLFAIECKLRKSLPKLLHSAMQQAINAHSDKMPIAVLHETGANSDDDFVVVRLADFERLSEAYQVQQAEAYQIQQLVDMLDDDDIQF